MLRHLYTSAVLLIATFCLTSDTLAQTVTFDTNFGDIVIELFAEEAPISVENFLGYVTRGDYDDTIFHRSVTDFVVQGGGFQANTSPLTVQPPIENEFGRSNLRGTIAFARVGGQVDSATSQFFFNLSDDNSFLDTVDEGFTVFGEVIQGLDVVDTINDLQIVNASVAIDSAFGELPVRDTFSDNILEAEDFVILNTATVTTTAVPEPSTLALLSGCSIIALTRRRR